MNTRITLWAALISILLLIAVLSSLFVASESQAAAAEPAQSLTEGDQNTVALPMLFSSDWQSRCYAPGTQKVGPASPGPNLPEIILHLGTTITVTTNADTINGDVSSVKLLLLNPGPDGVALREAITATNNDPGHYTILFSKLLDGTTIFTGAEDNSDLPPLTGGEVIIDGDMDGDLGPNITIANASSLEYPKGITIQSGFNTLHALELEGYYIGVAMRPTITNTTYKGAAISDMVIRGGSVGINLQAGPDSGVQASSNHWEDIYLINNDLDVAQDGITFHLNNTIGDHLANVTIHNNDIRVTQDIDSASFGIQLMAGFWAGSNDNVISNIKITKNSIRGNPDQAIGLMSGAAGASENVIDGVTIGGNEILISDPNWLFRAGKLGINLITGDGATDYIDPDYEPITYPEYNIIRNVDIIGNTIEGFDGRGIQVLGADGSGARHNKIEHLNILNNQICSTIPDVDYPVAGAFIQAGNGYPDHHNIENQISDIIFQSNAITLSSRSLLTDTHFAAAAVSVNGAGGGLGADLNQINDIWISLNEINSIVPGIHLIGGWVGATENVITTAQLHCNSIASDPVYPNWEPPLKGIVLTGAISSSTLNRVEGVSLYHNDVAGIWNDLTVIPNATDTAVDNVVDYKIVPEG